MAGAGLHPCVGEARFCRAVEFVLIVAQPQAMYSLIFVF